MRRSSSPLLRLGALAAIAAVAFSACSNRGGGESTAPGTSGQPAGSTAAGGTINIAINPWVGYESNAVPVTMRPTVAMMIQAQER